MGEAPEVPAEKSEPLRRAIISFRRNVAALRIFAEEIGKLVDRRDKAVLEEFAQSINALVGTEFDEASVEVSDGSPPCTDGPASLTARNSLAASTDSTTDTYFEQKLQATLKDPVKKREFLRSVMSFTQRHPAQGSILRISAVVTLMSHYESLVADLLHAFYELFPGALPAADRTLTLAEILELGSIDEARTFLIEKEVDSVLRESLKQQHAYFSQRPKVGLEALAPFDPVIAEVDQRRNIYVHNRAHVNRRYLKNVDSDLAQSFGAQDGKFLEADEAYLSHAINGVLCAGVALAQLCWRKWQPKAAQKADVLLIDIIYAALKDGHYDVVVALCEFAGKLRLKDDVSHRVVVVDHAIALKRLGRDSDALSLLAREDWSSCQAKFHVANQVLRGNRAQAMTTLRRAVRADEISAEDVREWPLFAELRTDADFIQLFRELFPDEPPLECLPQAPESADATLLATVDAREGELPLPSESGASKERHEDAGGAQLTSLTVPLEEFEADH